MMNSARNGFPFTASQWQELEHQVLIFKYMASGIPIPSHLLYTITRSLDSSISSKLSLHQPHQMGWSCFQMGFGRKIDPEPGRCRRTDGKKWRCSKEAYLDSKYCERHMNRGRNRSRKPVEVVVTTPSKSTALPFSSLTRNTSLSPSLTPLLTSEAHQQNHSHFSVSPTTHFSSQDNCFTTTTNFMLESDAFNLNGERAKMEIDELPFFSETSGTARTSISPGTSLHDSWHLAPVLTMGSSPLTLSNLKQRSYSVGGAWASYFQHQSLDNENHSSRIQKHDCYGIDSNDTPLQLMDRDDQKKKVMHHFFDELPLPPKEKEKDSWLDNDYDKQLLSIHPASSKVQLSISIPTSSNDFFLTRKEK